MKLIFRSSEQEQALAILNWCYPTPFDRYNFDADNIRLGNNLIVVAIDYKFSLLWQRPYHDNIPLT
jgi:hypothetical protein